MGRVRSFEMTIQQKLENAINEREEARRVMDSKKKYTRAWRMAEENLNFWQSKVAMLEVMNGNKKGVLK
jgi:hypothetical protein